MASTPYFAYKIVSSLARHVGEAMLVTQVRNQSVLTRAGRVERTSILSTQNTLPLL